MTAGKKSQNFEFSFEFGRGVIRSRKRGQIEGGSEFEVFFVEQNIRSLDIVIDFDRWFVLFTFFLKRVETDNLWSMYD